MEQGQDGLPHPDYHRLLVDIFWKLFIIKSVNIHTNKINGRVAQGMGQYDRTIKLLVDSNPEAIARFVLYAWQKQAGITLPNIQITSVTQLSTEFQSEEREADAVLLLEGPEGPLCLVQLEYQSRLHPFMPLRSLEYCARAKIKHWKEYGDLPIIAVVIYLFDEENVPEPPLRWLAPNGQTTLVFSYLSIKLKALPRKELLALHEPELWPLVLLTEGPVDRIIVGEMLADLLEHKLYRTLPICHTIAAWLLRGEDREWLHQEYEKMLDFFQDSPALKWMEEDVTKRVTERITEEVTARVTEEVTAQVTERVRREEQQRLLEERKKMQEEEYQRLLEERKKMQEEEYQRLLEERRKMQEEEHQRLLEERRKMQEEEHQRLREERKKALAMLRQTVVELVAQRFPAHERLARAQVRVLHKPESFQPLILRLSLARSAEEAEDVLLSLPEEEEEEVSIQEIDQQ